MKHLFLFSFFILNGFIFSQKKENIFKLDAIDSDKQYYSQAILEYMLVKQTIQKYGKIYSLMPIDKPELFVERGLLLSDSVKLAAFDQKYNETQLCLFCDKEQDSKKQDNNDSERCAFKLPLHLKDLTSGFQFKHYMLKGDNINTLKAFGIVDNEYSKENLYIVIDYIQYVDNTCFGLPKIRYGVGVRTEIKIKKWNNKLKSFSLSGLAASAELNSSEVSITMKTIGITGLGAKLNIPNNTSFDVKTYVEYQKIIDFIRTFEEYDSNKTNGAARTEKGKELILNDSTIIVKPELIPVMDEYRTSLDQSFEPLYEKITILQKKIKKVDKEISKDKNFKVENDENKKFKKSIADQTKGLIILKTKMISDEAKKLKEERDVLIGIDSILRNLKKYEKIFIQDNKTANEHEIEGFIHLKKKNISKAYESFDKSYILFPKLHNVDEIRKLLKEDKYKNILTSSDSQWKEIYQKIIKDYSWGMPEDIKQFMKDNIKE